MFDHGLVQSHLLGIPKIIAKVHAHVNNDGSCSFAAKLFAQDCFKDGSMVRTLNKEDVTHLNNTILWLSTVLVSTSFCSLISLLSDRYSFYCYAIFVQLITQFPQVANTTNSTQAWLTQISIRSIREHCFRKSFLHMQKVYCIFKVLLQMPIQKMCNKKVSPKAPEK